MNFEFSASGITTLLGILFITLKLCDVIHWSWGWVLAPFWVPLVLGVILIVIVCILKIIYKG